MSVKEALKLIVPRSLQYCRELSKLSGHLEPIGISSFCYSLYKDIYNKKARVSVILSSENAQIEYLNQLDGFSENAFSEYLNLPLHRNAVFDGFNQASANPIVKFQIAEGMRTALCLSFRNNFQRQTELFWFYGADDNPAGFANQVRNIYFFKKFILFFKERVNKLINKSFLTEEEIAYLFPENEANPLQQVGTEQPLSGEFTIEKFYFGYPFNAALSAKEFELLKLYFLGFSAKKIAKVLNISPRTTEKHIENIRLKSICPDAKELRQALFYCPLFLNLVCDLQLIL